MKSQDPRTFRKIINGASQEKHNSLSAISCEVLFEHFKCFNPVDSADDGNSSEVNNERDIDNCTLLNRLFTTEEVMECITGLKSHKACEDDLIINKFLDLW